MQSLITENEKKRHFAFSWQQDQHNQYSRTPLNDGTLSEKRALGDLLTERTPERHLHRPRWYGPRHTVAARHRLELLGYSLPGTLLGRMLQPTVTQWCPCVWAPLTHSRCSDTMLWETRDTRPDWSLQDRPEGALGECVRGEWVWRPGHYCVLPQTPPHCALSAERTLRL